MKRIAAIAIAVFLFLFSVSAFADTSNNSNLIPVQDSNIQSSGWSNYIPAQGNGISGAAILQDSSTNQSLRKRKISSHTQQTTSNSKMVMKQLE